MVISLVISTCGEEYSAPIRSHWHCVCGRVLPATKTVGQALSSQNVSNRTTS
jgi:hypothetical protein